MKTKAQYPKCHTLDDASMPVTKVDYQPLAGPEVRVRVNLWPGSVDASPRKPMRVDPQGRELFTDSKGRVLFVSDGLSRGKLWGTFTRRANGSLRRIKSPRLPMHANKVHAEADLRAFCEPKRIERERKTYAAAREACTFCHDTGKIEFTGPDGRVISTACNKCHASPNSVRSVATNLSQPTETIMATKTKKVGSRRKAVGGPKANGPILDIESVEPKDIPLGLISASPFQPRQEFDEAELQSLADSIKREGLLVPVSVRRDMDGYQLLDGERRLRAAKLAGLEKIRAEVRECSDAEARVIVLVSAAQRKDLNPIEKARALRAMIDAGDCKGPTEVAKRIGWSQGAVSNVLGLLKLPEAWQQRVISQEISERHARLLVPHAGDTQAMEQLEVAYQKCLDDDLADLDVRSFDSQVVQAGLSAAGRRHIEEVSRGDAEDAEENETTEDTEHTEGDGSDAGGLTSRPQQQPARQASVAPPPQDPFARKLGELLQNVRRWMIANWLRDAADGAGRDDMLRLALLAIAWCEDGSTLNLGIRAAYPNAQKRLERFGTTRVILDAEPAPLGDIAGEAIAAMLCSEDGVPVLNRMVEGDLETICEWGNLTIAKMWDEMTAKEKLGPFTREYFDLHSTEQLHALAKELGVCQAGPIKTMGMTRRDLIEKFLADEDLPLPAELGGEKAKKAKSRKE